MGLMYENNSLTTGGSTSRDTITLKVYQDGLKTREKSRKEELSLSDQPGCLMSWQGRD